MTCLRASSAVTALAKSPVPVTSTCAPWRVTRDDAGQRGERLLIERRHRPEPHPVLAPGGVHQPRRGVQRRDPPPFEDRNAVAQFFHLVHEVADQHDRDAAARTWLIRSQVARLAPGSRPAVSSSRNTTSGFPTRPAR